MPTTMPRQASDREIDKHMIELLAKTVSDAWSKGTGQPMSVEQVKTRYREMAMTLAAVAAWQPGKDAH